MLILLRRYSFIPDIARVTSEPRANIKVFASGIVYYLQLRERKRERERVTSSLSRKPCVRHSIFIRFYRDLFSSSAFLSSFVSFYRIIHGLASYRNFPLSRPFGYPKPRAKIIDSTGQTRCVPFRWSRGPSLSIVSGYPAL